MSTEIKFKTQDTSVRKNAVDVRHTPVAATCARALLATGVKCPGVGGERWKRNDVERTKRTHGRVRQPRRDGFPVDDPKRNRSGHADGAAISIVYCYDGLAIASISFRPRPSDGFTFHGYNRSQRLNWKRFFSRSIFTRPMHRTDCFPHTHTHKQTLSNAYLTPFKLYFLGVFNKRFDTMFIITYSPFCFARAIFLLFEVFEYGRFFSVRTINRQWLMRVRIAFRTAVSRAVTGSLMSRNTWTQVRLWNFKITKTVHSTLEGFGFPCIFKNAFFPTTVAVKRKILRSRADRTRTVGIQMHSPWWKVERRSAESRR